MRSILWGCAKGSRLGVTVPQLVVVGDLSVPHSNARDVARLVGALSRRHIGLCPVLNAKSVRIRRLIQLQVGELPIGRYHGELAQCLPDRLPAFETAGSRRGRTGLDTPLLTP